MQKIDDKRRVLEDSLNKFKGLSERMSATMRDISKHNEGISVARRYISNLQSEIITLRGKLSSLKSEDSNKIGLQY
jgi:hypothetical protein